MDGVGNVPKQKGSQSSRVDWGEKLNPVDGMGMIRMDDWGMFSIWDISKVIEKSRNVPIVIGKCKDIPKVSEWMELVWPLRRYFQGEYTTKVQCDF